jgi:hypothetical protein
MLASGGRLASRAGPTCRAGWRMLQDLSSPAQLHSDTCAMLCSSGSTWPLIPPSNSRGDERSSLMSVGTCRCVSVAITRVTRVGVS